MNNIATVKDLYQAFNRGDLPYVMERFGELESSGVVADAQKRAPWHFALKGKKDLQRYFEALMGAMEPMGLEARDFAEAGDLVYARLSQKWKVRATGKVLAMRDGVHVFRFRDGRCVEWRAYEDTALSCEAIGA
jgi:ketosteroid isomerase-like protein